MFPLRFGGRRVQYPAPAQGGSMTGNPYDDPAFFAGYATLPRSVHGLDGAPEWPSLRALLPPLAGLDVLDLGCGHGWFSRHAAGEGARRVLGLDSSRLMLARAREANAHPAIAYELADLEALQLALASFDVAWSSLAFHYVERLGEMLGRVHGALRPGGALVFSVEHPVYSAPARPGWTKDAQGRLSWPVDGYMREGPREVDWRRARRQAPPPRLDHDQRRAARGLRPVACRGVATQRRADRRAAVARRRARAPDVPAARRAPRVMSAPRPLPRAPAAPSPTRSPLPGGA
jgi:SAM-dependent methyltransferase